MNSWQNPVPEIIERYACLLQAVKKQAWIKFSINIKII
jgi:hypothetical protein